jgi:hypothetical protein
MPGADTVAFDIGGGGVQTITPPRRCPSWPSTLIIGGSDPALRNLISSNTQDRIVLYSATDSAILGNCLATGNVHAILDATSDLP